MKQEMNIEEELSALLENEWFWLHNFNTDEKQNEEQRNHNDKEAQSLKEKLEKKYPNISLDVDTIKRLGVQYTKWHRKQVAERELQADWKKYREEQEAYPDWLSSGSCLDVQVTHRLMKRGEELRKIKVKSPMDELKVIIIASKVDPDNLDINLLEDLRKGNWQGKFTNQLLQTTYELYCDKKEKDGQIEDLESEKNELLSKVDDRDKSITSKNEEIRALKRENQELEEKLSDSNNRNNSIQSENDELTNMVSRLQEILSKTLSFCNVVKRSRFGKFFFRKQIKELPAPEETESEIEM